MAGVSHLDRKIGAEVRRLTLNRIKAILLDENHEKYDEDFQKQIILKLASTVLPRINEHTGEDGNPIVINVSKEGAEKYGINSTSIPSGDTVGQA